METTTTLPLTKEQLIANYCLAVRSRQASVIGRGEVLSGKAFSNRGFPHPHTHRPTLAPSTQSANNHPSI